MKLYDEKRKIILLNIGLEFFLLNQCFLMLYITVGRQETMWSGFMNQEFIWLILMLNLSWISVLAINGKSVYYLRNKFNNRGNYLLLNTLLLAGITFLAGTLFSLHYLKSESYLLSVILFFVVTYISFIGLSKIKFRSKTKVFSPNILFIGADDQETKVSALHEIIQANGYQNVNLVKEKALVHTFEHEGNGSGHPDALTQILTSSNVDEIFVNLEAIKENELSQVVKTADFHGVKINLIPMTPYFMGKKIRSSNTGELPVIDLRHSPLDHFHNYLFKKIFDVVFSLGVLVFLSPVYLIISILIALDSKGPVFYIPTRNGKEGKPFKCYKFRTMSVCDDPLQGAKSTEKNDPRITRVGKILRKYDLDELPQFFNVLKGDMSVVGPRPHRIHLKDDFRKIVNHYMVRHFVKPGLTGWAQVNGWRGPTKTTEQKEERIRHDLWYIEEWSLWLDIKIIYQTVFSKKARMNAF